MEPAVNDLRQACLQLVGLQCRSVIAGAGTGSRMSLGFGEARARRKPLTNSTLSEFQKKFETSHKLFITCSWRLDAPSRVICGAWDDNREGGPMLEGLARLCDHRVSDLLFRQPGLDLELTFDHGLRLTIFCDQVNESDEDDNYSVFLPQEILTVGTKSAIRSTERVW